MAPLSVTLEQLWGTCNQHSAEEPARGRRRVSFAFREKVWEIPSRSEFTKKEKARIWLTADDYWRSRMSKIETLELIDSGKLLVKDDDAHCTLGLKEAYPKISALGKVLRRKSQNAVFLEQRAQHHGGHAHAVPFTSHDAYGCLFVG